MKKYVNLQNYFKDEAENPVANEIGTLQSE